MTDRPLIAVTTTLWPGGSFGLPRTQLNAQYIDALESPGATALLLTPAHGEDSIRRLLGLCHGLLLTGGEDVDPVRYGAEPHPQLGEINPARDAAELAAVHEARRLGLPILAICRGIQVLNVALGGTLYQDIPSELGGDVLHEQTSDWRERSHAGRVEAGSTLEQVFGASELRINSFHHQAVRDVAPGLRATVWAEDGVVEGVEGTEGGWVCGVQWHPERGEAHGPDADERDPDRRLFWAFVQAAREFAAESAAAVSIGGD
ncbi:gamma-glutamyl-gamma-aminobutyrate hydrolase family protein [Longimicrobium terrae]|uniref:Putative glutamine amidotransferase n=1 Tax=Longimicrobium terrae TaxID=1639882 RepID=A0A841GXP5_9BACT|nr:gamma-glutamyl-gamma-aminobutyrate hydrolase family protein [Longimicrobium terrae]MBB4636118.1 putative glutamine amidotransferase [Longimicrobium terrae]MBB6070513.1 putative glutamine amidotransferase [Longimicrobium terrae]NNC29503.1 gamma-glutamyl-gamma-aminobutyrate hydrolase family protein [Longimicrobium terrae]